MQDLKRLRKEREEVKLVCQIAGAKLAHWREKFLDVKIADGESFTDLLGVPLTMLNKRREIEKIDNAQPKLKLQHLPKVQDDFKNINVGMTDSCAALLAPLWSEVLHLHHCCVVERLQAQKTERKVNMLRDEQKAIRCNLKQAECHARHLERKIKEFEAQSNFEAADYTAATAKQNFASKEVLASKERFTALECNRKKVNACVKKIEYEVNRDNAQQNNIVAGESLLVENKSKMKPLERTGVKDFKQQWILAENAIKMALQNMAAIGIGHQDTEDKLLEKWKVNPPKNPLSPTAVTPSLKSNMEVLSDVKDNKLNECEKLLTCFNLTIKKMIDEYTILKLCRSQDGLIALQDASNRIFETRQIDSRDAALLEIENLQYRFEHDIDNLEKRYQDSQLFAAKQMSALVRQHEKSMADERKEYEHELQEASDLLRSKYENIEKDRSALKDQSEQYKDKHNRMELAYKEELCSAKINHAVEVGHLRQKYEDYVLDIASASENVKLAITEAWRRSKNEISDIRKSCIKNHRKIQRALMRRLNEANKAMSHLVRKFNGVTLFDRVMTYYYPPL